jgi:phage repressor protein C with HTH and peptisase S24 domain
MVDTFSERLLAAKAARGKVSNYALSKLTGIADNLLGKYDKGTLPNVDYAAAIADALDISLEWLISGRGEMDRQPSSLAPTLTGEAIPPEFALIPYLQVEASAGGGAINHGEETAQMLAFRNEWLHRNGISPVHAKALTVLGDSMEPTLSSGDVILVDTRVGDVGQPGIYVIRVDDRLMVKRIQPKFGGALILIPENPVYSQEEIPADKADQMAVIGLVRWCGKLI